MSPSLPANGARFRFVALAALGLVAACNSGKGAAGSCPGYGACGGDPSGDWKLSDACENLTLKPYQQLSLPDQLRQPQDPTLEPPQPTPTTSGNWCSDLIYQPADQNAPVKGVVLWHGALGVHAGTLHHNLADHSYSAAVTFQAHEHVFFPQACLSTYARESNAPTCDQLAKGLDQYFQTYPSFKNFICSGEDGGCACDYDYQLVAADNGVWEVDPDDAHVIIHHSINGSEPHRSTFCVAGGKLQMTGNNGTSLLNQLGLRSVQYEPLNGDAGTSEDAAKDALGEAGPNEAGPNEAGSSDAGATAGKTADGATDASATDVGTTGG